MKRQKFLSKDRYDGACFADCTAQEIQRCEQIRRNPHADLASYLGGEAKIVCGEERVSGLAYKRYIMDLHTFVFERKF